MGTGVASARSRGSERPGVGDPVDLTSISRVLANDLVAQLDDRPFRPSTAQLAWVWGGALARREALPTRVRIAACRYAAMFADQAFIESMTSADRAQRPTPVYRNGRLGRHGCVAAACGCVPEIAATPRRN
jgi:hypothetical protein